MRNTLSGVSHLLGVDGKTIKVLLKRKNYLIQQIKKCATSPLTKKYGFTARPTL